MTPKKVLVIDDSPIMRRIIIDILAVNEKLDIVGEAENGQQALEMLSQFKPELVLVDIEMPIMDGLSFIRHARLKSRAKIVVLSSVTGPASEKAVEARRLGVDAIVSKPSGAISFDLAAKTGSELMTKINSLIEEEK